MVPRLAIFNCDHIKSSFFFFFKSSAYQKNGLVNNRTWEIESNPGAVQAVPGGREPSQNSACM